MFCLRCLHFVLYLPVETKLENVDLDWFNLNHDTVQYEINELTMLLYTVPYLLNSQRQVYHTLLRQSTMNKNITDIQWRIDRDLLSLDQTLIHFRHVDSLFLSIDMKVKIFNECRWISSSIENI